LFEHGNQNIEETPNGVITITSPRGVLDYAFNPDKGPLTY